MEITKEYWFFLKGEQNKGIKGHYQGLNLSMKVNIMGKYSYYIN